MSLRIEINVASRVDEELATLASRLQDRTGLNAQIAGDAEAFVKARGAVTAASEHKTASSLGAKPTGHLAEAYEGVEGISDQNAATLLVPGAGRLRAAFGDYTIKPGAGKYYLTIPVAKDSYGRRAGEFGDELFFTRVGPKRTPVLARRQERVETGAIQNRSRKGKRYDNTKPLEVLYILSRESKMPEDKGLIPFDDLADEALDSAEEYLDGEIERSLT